VANWHPNGYLYAKLTSSQRILVSLQTPPAKCDRSSTFHTRCPLVVATAIASIACDQEKRDSRHGPTVLPTSLFGDEIRSCAMGYDPLDQVLSFIDLAASGLEDCQLQSR
jgi:hypothetical protein